MEAFWSGMAIGLAISAVLAVVFGAIFLIVWIGEWIIAIVYGTVVATRDGMRAERVRIDAERAKLGLPPLDR